MEDNRIWALRDELRYRRWLQEWTEMTGTQYDPNDPDWDYRIAFRNRLGPEYVPDESVWMWPDNIKRKKNSER